MKQIAEKVAAAIARTKLPGNFPHSEHVNFVVRVTAAALAAKPVDGNTMAHAIKIAVSLSQHLGLPFGGKETDLPKFLLAARQVAEDRDRCEAYSSWVPP